MSFSIIKIIKSQSCVTDLLPVLGLPLGTGLQTARLCAVWPQRGATAMRRRAVHQPLPHAFTTAARALRKKNEDLREVSAFR